MKGFVCGVCGYIPLSGEVPEKCPVCMAPKKVFQEKDDAIKEPSKDTEKLESNKKHIPVIKIEKKCGLIPDGCTDAHIKVGEIIHPMTKEHSILYVDVYLDKEFLTRMHFVPEKLNPAACIHLKVNSGKISVIECCNLHGSWLGEQDI